MNTPLRGVNLGGWLVLEKWMTPSLFEGTSAHDEYTFMQLPGAAKKLAVHRQTFIVEDDFRWLAEHGVTAVRIPVGYWVIHPDGPYSEGLNALDWAFAMAEKYSLQVLLDLHGAAGSQNGKDHSGKVGVAEWFKSANSRARTQRTVRALYERYGVSPVFWGLQILNEPKLGLLHWKLRAYYRSVAKEFAGSSTRIIFHDAFTPSLLSGALRGTGARAVMDIHLYHMASFWAKFVSVEWFVRHTSWWYGVILRRARRRQPVVVGEWSVVLRGESLQGHSVEEQQQLMKTYGVAQLDAYETWSDGWFYWSYKTEQPGVWSFRSVIEDKILFLPPLDKK